MKIDISNLQYCFNCLIFIKILKKLDGFQGTGYGAVIELV